MGLCILSIFVFFLLCCIAAASPLLCPRQSEPFLFHTVRSPCHLSFPIISLREVVGDIFERAISSKMGNVYTSVLFYASRCPFSYSARIHFEVLSSLYTQMEHLAVEQSSAMPSLFSRYGIHSLPAILIVNGTSRLWYHGSKDLESLILFYNRITGYGPVSYINYMKNEQDPLITASLADKFESREKFVLQSWIGLSAMEILKRETYLVCSVLFLCLRLVLFAFPRVLHYVRGILALCEPNLNLQIFGEASQVFGHVLRMMDAKRLWTKPRLCKSRSFQQGARNARVWASSLTSVSLGETSRSTL